VTPVRKYTKAKARTDDCFHGGCHSVEYKYKMSNFVFTSHNFMSRKGPWRFGWFDKLSDRPEPSARKKIKVRALNQSVKGGSLLFSNANHLHLCKFLKMKCPHFLKH
jgi:hypothetical protein